MQHLWKQGLHLVLLLTTVTVFVLSISKSIDFGGTVYYNCFGRLVLQKKEICTYKPKKLLIKPSIKMKKSQRLRLINDGDFHKGHCQTFYQF